MPILALVVVCENPENRRAPIKQVKDTTVYILREHIADEIEIVVIDKCEYVIYSRTDDQNKGFGYMAHKGNYKNPAHLYRSDFRRSLLH